MLADELDFVIGVDTHRDAHALALVAAPSGAVVHLEPSLPASPRGYRRLLQLAQADAPGLRAFAVEGTGRRGGRRRLLLRPQRARRPLAAPRRRGPRKGSYAYSAYGSPFGDLTREEAEDTTTPFNPYRFNDRRLDSLSGSADMGARRYSSALGGGRFLQSDSYEGAGDDLSLSLDPLTMNRYGFAAGNPLSFVETDGHAFAAESPSKAPRRRMASGAANSPDSRLVTSRPGPERGRDQTSQKAPSLACAPYKASVCDDLMSIARSVGEEALQEGAIYATGVEAIRLNKTLGIHVSGVERVSRIRALVHTLRGGQKPSGFTMALNESKSTGITLQSARRSVPVVRPALRAARLGGPLSGVTQGVLDANDDYSTSARIGRAGLATATGGVSAGVGTGAAALCTGATIGIGAPACVAGGVVLAGVTQYGLNRFVADPVSEALGWGSLR